MYLIIRRTLLQDTKVEKEKETKEIYYYLKKIKKQIKFGEPRFNIYMLSYVKKKINYYLNICLKINQF